MYNSINQIKNLEICGYKAEGFFENLNQIKNIPAICIVLGKSKLNKGLGGAEFQFKSQEQIGLWKIIDIYQSTNIQTKTRLHKRKQEWLKKGYNHIAFALIYQKDQQSRLQTEFKLKEFYNISHGTECFLNDSLYLKNKNIDIAKMARTLVKALKATSKEVSDNVTATIHFYFGGGRTINLKDANLLRAVQNFYHKNYFIRFKQQISDKAILINEGSFSDSFINSYNFRPVSFFLGNSTISGRFNGNVSNSGNDTRHIKGKIYFEYSDEFVDPLDIKEIMIKLCTKYFGVSRKIATLIVTYILDNRQLFDYNLGGTPYNIIGQWQENVSFTFKI